MSRISTYFLKFYRQLSNPAANSASIPDALPPQHTNPHPQTKLHPQFIPQTLSSTNASASNLHLFSQILQPIVKLSCKLSMHSRCPAGSTNKSVQSKLHPEFIPQSIPLPGICASFLKFSRQLSTPATN